MCTQSPSKSAPKGGAHKRFDFDCMIIMDIYIKSLEKSAYEYWMDYGENPISPLTIPLPMDGLTNLPNPQDTSSIGCQLAGQNTETMLVVLLSGCHPEDLPVPLFW